jgi:hypothetical protein
MKKLVLQQMDEYNTLKFKYQISDACYFGHSKKILLLKDENNLKERFF